MQTIGGVNDSAFSDKPFDPAAARSWLERIVAIHFAAATILTPKGRADMAEAYAAAEAQTRLVATSSARAAAHEGWYDDAIDKIRDATGVTLDNPLLRSTSELAGRIGRGEFRGWLDPRLSELIAGREDAFLARARELKQPQPDKLAGLDLDTPISTQAAGMTRVAQQRLQGFLAREDINPAASALGLLAGSVAGSRRDPMFWLSFMAPVGGKGATALSRVGHAALTQGLANAALNGVAQPAIQAWRQEAGLPSGFGEAAGDVAMAGLVGGALGGGLRGAGESLPALRRLLTGKAGVADRETLANAGLHVSEPDAVAMREAAKGQAADAEALAAAGRLPPQDARMALAEGMAHLEEPSQPPPLARGPAGDDAPARALLDAAPGLDDAVTALRGDARALDAALASADPQIRDAGRLATLDESAFALVRSGAVDPLHAVAVAATTRDPAAQGALMNVLKEARPQSMAEARQAVADHVAVGNARAAAEARMGAAEHVLKPHRVVDADGRSIVVQPKVVEASDVLASSDRGFDASLQPRDRSRAASGQQVREMAARLDPERLGISAEADRGAPIVSHDGMVESGNGRVMAIRSAYDAGGEPAAAYREFLAAQGLDVTAYKQPILVRERLTVLDDAERAAFVIAANRSTTLAFSASERALADARLLDADTLALLRNPTDLAAVANRDFVKSVLRALPQSEHGAFVMADGALSSEGVTRLRAAITASAFGGSPVLARIAEATSDDVKSISNALLQSAPIWAQLRADVRSGFVRSDVDITANLLEAVEKTAHLRSTGGKLNDLLAQHDAFNPIHPLTADFMRMFYDQKGGRAAGQQRIADALMFYASEARKVSADMGLDLGLAPVDAQSLIAAATAKARKNETTTTNLFDRQAGDGAGATGAGGEIQRPGAGEPRARAGGGGDARPDAAAPAAGPARDPADLRGHVPIADEAGVARLVSRDALDGVARAERRWADVVSACKS